MSSNSSRRPSFNTDALKFRNHPDLQDHGEFASLMESVDRAFAEFESRRLPVKQSSPKACAITAATSQGDDIRDELVNIRTPVGAGTVRSCDLEEPTRIYPPGTFERMMNTLSKFRCEP